MTRAVDWSDPPHPKVFPVPKHLTTPAESERWVLCEGIVLELWRLYEDDDAPLDREWALGTLHSMYRSDVPTGSPVP